MRLFVLVVVAALGAGCMGASLVAPQSAGAVDAPAVRPSTEFYDVGGEPTSTTYYGLVPAEPFHSFDEVESHVLGWAQARPDLVQVRVIGESREGRPLWDVVLTNASRPGPKPVVLFDGGHHGNELAGVEMALYVVDFLLANAQNATVASWLDTLEIHTVPIVNPDGYVASSRGNALGVNLNRNYDIDWGNPLGASNGVMGTLAHAADQSMPSVAIVAENCGPHPFSEPETQAMRDLLDDVGDRLVAYLTYHTPTNALAAPWSAYDPPFPMPPAHDALFEHVLQWTRDNTEYRAGKAQWANFSAGLPYAASGSSADYVYATHLAPSFTLEIEIWYMSVQSERYAERVYLEPYDGLAYWMEASLPIPLYLLANWDALGSWGLPGRAPPLPEGIPPAPVPPDVKAYLVSPEDHHEGAPEDPARLPGVLERTPEAPARLQADG